MRNFLFVLFSVYSFFINAQLIEDDVSSLYREDQFYIGFSFISLETKNDYFNQNGLSSHFQFGFIRDIPLTSSGKFALGLGLGYSFQQYNSNLVRVVIDNSNSIFTLNQKTSDLDKSLLSFNFIEFPISLRWRNSSINDYEFWRIYSGVKFQKNFFSRLRSRQNNENVVDEINKWTKDLYISFGYNTWNFYFSYGLSPLIKKLKLHDSNKLFKIKPIKIGLIFFLL